MEFNKIVLTGGPGAGKSTAMKHIKSAFESLGYCVVTLPEVATEMIVGGVAPWTCGSNYDFQKQQLKLLLSTEDCFEDAAKTMPAKKLLLLCDRGALDGKAYLEAGEYAKMLKELGFTESELQERYAAVFHLITPAKGLEKAYTTANNAARTETAQEAAEKDNKTLAAWATHKKHFIIKNEPEFEDKMNNLIFNIQKALNINPPAEIERKFLISMPNVQMLEQFCKKIYISQTYLSTNEQNEVRIRMKSCNGKGKYTFTKKCRITNETRIEEEREITKEQYLMLLKKADQNCRTIEKIRYKLGHAGKTFEIDIYPFWPTVATMEVELNNEMESFDIPQGIDIIRDVTNDKKFKNSNLAKSTDEWLNNMIEEYVKEKC